MVQSSKFLSLNLPPNWAASLPFGRRTTPSALESVERASASDCLFSGLKAIVSDFQIIFERDPAARNWLEVLLCYPGFHSLTLHRFAHWLHHLRLPVLPRFIAHVGRFLTGIEIHPGAAIGQGVFIDHGMGVVIGETAIVGDYALIYQGATLGGTGKESGKRHPTLGNHVVVGAGAKVLGNIEIGDCVRIGAGSIVLRDVPSDCTVVGVPGRNLCRTKTPFCPLDHNQMPDAEASAIRMLLERIEHLERQLQTLTPPASQSHDTHTPH
ncbi:serine O-acetyltransferase [Altericista sp. CCNU0014]|uniref:serine O-acetyltransferase n=1 Tax=Altericista sp. CCNU0014 TaxID=3082949 RepID=UPI00384B6229